MGMWESAKSILDDLSDERHTDKFRVVRAEASEHFAFEKKIALGELPI